MMAPRTKAERHQRPRSSPTKIMVGITMRPLVSSRVRLGRAAARRVPFATGATKAAAYEVLETFGA